MNDPLSHGERFEREWLFAATPERVWPLLADTDRLNQTMGNPPVQATDMPDPRGGLLRQGSYSLYGMPMKWEELPYEWIEGRELGVRRRFIGGPLEAFAMRIALTPEAGGTRVRLRLEFLARHAVLRPLVRVVARGMVKAFEGAFDRFRDYFAGQVPDPYALAAPPLSELPHARARAIADRLQTLGLSPTALEALVSHVLTAPDDELAKMRPFQLAKRWGADRREVLKIFLHATKAGLLELKWDLLCPGCRGASASHDSLAGLPGKAHCPVCQIDTSADFGQSVELSFRPNPAIRRIEQRDY